MTQGKMTYDLRRLRVHGFIERIPCSHRYRVTDVGFRSAFLITRAHARLLRPGLSVLGQREPPLPAPLRNGLRQAELAIERSWQAAA